MSRDLASAESTENQEFQDLFRRYYRPLTHFFRRRECSAEVSRDLVQETFLRVYRGLPSLRREASPESWLFAIAANVWRNQIRSDLAQKRQGNELPLDLFGSGISPPGEEDAEGSLRRQETAAFYDDPVALDELLNQERVQRLRDAIYDLPPQMRRCIYLQIGHGLRYSEIAELLQISLATVRAHLYQARERLRHSLGLEASESP